MKLEDIKIGHKYYICPYKTLSTTYIGTVVSMDENRIVCRQGYDLYYVYKLEDFISPVYKEPKVLKRWWEFWK